MQTAKSGPHAKFITEHRHTSLRFGTAIAISGFWASFAQSLACGNGELSIIHCRGEKKKKENGARKRRLAAIFTRRDEPRDVTR